MKQIIVALLLSILSSTASAKVSAVREANQDYREAARKMINTRSLKYQFLKGTDAYSSRSSQADFSQVSEWKNGDIHKAFKSIRDERFMQDDTGFARRPTWLYPYDGCYARAEVATHRLEQKGFSKPSKVFVFGDLEVKSSNADGVVSWWYHVAVAYRHNNTVYIFDPAIEPQKLLTIAEWSKLMGPDEKEFSICSDATYDPEWSCESSKQLPFSRAQEDQSSFFEAEKENILSLGRNPENELGENTPWSK